jgi:hypothetical protein
MANARLRRTIGQVLLLAPITWERAARFAATAWVLALAGIWASQQVHAGLHEHLELSPLDHLVRDASLAVPLAAIAVAVGGLLAVEGARVLQLAPASLAGRLLFGIVAAFVFAALSVPGNQMHTLLFGAEEEEVGWLADVLLDGAVVLAAALAVLVPASVARLAPWPPEPGDSLPLGMPVAAVDA